MRGASPLWAKPVLTLGEGEVRQAVLALWQRVCAAAGRPDLVVGIATGGLHCARVLAAEAPVLPVTLRRRGSRTKGRGPVRAVLRCLPYALSDALRRLEDLARERFGTAPVRSGQAGPAEQDGARGAIGAEIGAIRAEVERMQARSVLVLDDALDSGATLRMVVEALQEALPAGVRIVTAVVTQTREGALMRADFALHQGVLCRFPWSQDFRGR